MRKILLPLLFVGGTAFAHPSVDGGINNPDAAIEEIDKSMAAINSVEQNILKEFNRTPLQTRVVKIRVKRGKKKTKVYVTWHPVKKSNIPSDTFLIIKIVTKVIPNFYFVSLQAIDPAYMRWSGRVIWNSVINKKAIIINRFVDHQPQPLYQ